MFLSTITSNSNISHVKESLNLFKITKNLKEEKFFLNNSGKQIDFNKSNQTSYQIKQNLISYIIKINLSKTNTLVTITDILGAKKKTFSAGSVGLTKKQKKKTANGFNKNI